MRRTVAFTTAAALAALLWAPPSFADEGVAEPPEPPQPICLHPVGAIICLGAVILASSCGFGFSCSGERPGTGGSNPPDSGGGGQPGDGDGDSEGSGGGGSDDE